MQSGGGGGGVYNGSFCHTPLGIRVNFILSIYLNLFLKGGRA